MPVADAFGWSAAALMVCTFACRDARAMRPLAVATNLAFIGYGAMGSLAPVLALHALLLPINLWRWAECLGAREFQMFRHALRGAARALLPALLGLLAACGGGAGPEPEPEPLEFIQVNRFIGPERYEEPGAYHASVEMGGLPFILPGYDAIAQGEIFSSETGNTFWNDVQVQPDGRIVAAGLARNGLAASSALIRLLP